MITKKPGPITVGFVPWWPQNPYQLLLRESLRNLGIRIIGNPPLSILKLLIFRDGLDIIHLHWPHDLYYKNYWKLPYVVFLLLMYRLLKNNIVWTVHELTFYETRFPLIDKLFVKFLFKICHSIIVHSKFSANEIRSKYKFQHNISISKHPSYLGYYPNTVSRKNARDKFSLPSDVITILFFGYIKPYKGVEDLIEEFKKIHNEKLHLIIAGNTLNDEIKNKIISLAKNDIRVTTDLRYIADDEIQYFMNAADIVAFPFRYTHTSGSALLALSFGKPVIVPRIASLPEYIPEDVGVFFDPALSGSLAGALLSIASLDLVAMQAKAFNAIKELSWTVFSEYHAKIYRRIIGL
jgi:beta-1,4-mannosyltransferase